MVVRWWFFYFHYSCFLKICWHSTMRAYFPFSSICLICVDSWVPTLVTLQLIDYGQWEPCQGGICHFDRPHNSFCTSHCGELIVGPQRCPHPNPLKAPGSSGGAHCNHSDPHRGRGREDQTEKRRCEGRRGSERRTWRCHTADLKNGGEGHEILNVIWGFLLSFCIVNKSKHFLALYEFFWS